ncbi:hypothetical protein GGX14DRAFT_572978 [Mycena pura]|uniref:Uncharacterized protein n=1 Tax=Mycena pura TaxID=153505 RepID=A0AAD6V036_9AGAR|nr:hypothetical protein GGX14DRAFT_572978 [Mycena pura]
MSQASRSGWVDPTFGRWGEGQSNVKETKGDLPVQQYHLRPEGWISFTFRLRPDGGNARDHPFTGIFYHVKSRRSASEPTLGRFFTYSARPLYAAPAVSSPPPSRHPRRLVTHVYAAAFSVCRPRRPAFRMPQWASFRRHAPPPPGTALRSSYERARARFPCPTLPLPPRTSIERSFFMPRAAATRIRPAHARTSAHGLAFGAEEEGQQERVDARDEGGDAHERPTEGVCELVAYADGEQFVVEHAVEIAVLRRSGSVCSEFGFDARRCRPLRLPAPLPCNAPRRTTARACSRECAQFALDPPPPLPLATPLRRPPTRRRGLAFDARHRRRSPTPLRRRHLTPHAAATAWRRSVPPGDAPRRRCRPARVGFLRPTALSPRAAAPHRARTLTRAAATTPRRRTAPPLLPGNAPRHCRCPASRARSPVPPRPPGDAPRRRYRLATPRTAGSASSPALHHPCGGFDARCRALCHAAAPPAHALMSVRSRALCHAVAPPAHAPMSVRGLRRSLRCTTPAQVSTPGAAPCAAGVAPRAYFDARRHARNPRAHFETRCHALCHATAPPVALSRVSALRGGCDPRVVARRRCCRTPLSPPVHAPLAVWAIPDIATLLS